MVRSWRRAWFAYCHRIRFSDHVRAVKVFLSLLPTFDGCIYTYVQGPLDGSVGAECFSNNRALRKFSNIFHKADSFCKSNPGRRFCRFKSFRPRIIFG